MPFHPRTRPFQKVYKLALIASSFGCTLWPIVISSASFMLLPVKLAVVPVIGVVAIGFLPIPEEPPRYVRQMFKDAVMAAKEWLRIEVKFNSEQFQEAGPYVIGLSLACG